MLCPFSHCFVVISAIAVLSCLLTGCDTDDDFDYAEPIQVTGLESKSIQMKCPLPVSDPPEIKWYDKVYNSDPNPNLIFDSNNNTDRLIVENHPKRFSYEVTAVRLVLFFSSDFCHIEGELSEPSNDCCDFHRVRLIVKQNY